MTTSNKPRDINELLTCDTYQGMSDDEIDMIISYKVSREVRSKLADADRLERTMAFERMIEDNKASCQEINDKLQSLLNMKPELVSFEGDA